MTDELFIQDLAIRTIIGVLPFERHQTQLIYIDLCLSLNLRPASQTDSLEHSIDYSQVATDLERWANECTPKLIETLAESLCTQMLQHYPCDSLTLTLRKPGALPNAIVGVRLTRNRSRLAL